MIRETRTAWFVVISCFVFNSCSWVSTVENDGAPAQPADVSSVKDAVPRDEPRSKYGNPDSYEVFGRRYYVLNDSSGFVERGIASWYGTKFHGRRTSSGETYDMYAMTAAHKTLPLPTYVEVINLENNKRVIVKVNDRGPFHDNRVIDLSYSAASKLGILARGTGLVEVRAIDPDYYSPGSSPGLRTVGLSKETVSQFYIQVGAFSEPLNAERLQARLSPLGDSIVKISQATVNGQQVYRVRLGPFVDVENADDIVRQLPRYGLNDHHVVID